MKGFTNSTPTYRSRWHSAFNSNNGIRGNTGFECHVTDRQCVFFPKLFKCFHAYNNNILNTYLTSCLHGVIIHNVTILLLQ